DLESPVPQAEIVDDPVVQQPGQVRARRDDETRPHLFQGGGAADPVAPFEHQDALACPGQVGGGCEAVVTGPDHHHVPRAAQGPGVRGSKETGEEAVHDRKDASTAAIASMERSSIGSSTSCTASTPAAAVSARTAT